MPRLSKFGAAALAAFGWTSGGAGAVTASYLQVAGGGGGAAGNGGGGGGAGGYLTGTTSLNPTLSYTVIVGSGGAGGASFAAIGSNGSNSQFGTLTASVGGGYGASSTNVSTQNGGSGGSGGGGSAYTTGFSGTGGSPTSGQGNSGGNGSFVSGYPAGAGGGGAGAAGSNGTGSVGGNGGNGTASSISGSSVTYAGGGGGSPDSRITTSSSTGGTGGGGAGNATTAGTSGTANTGGGGGGGGLTLSPTVGYNGGNGGSGIVIISYAGAQQFGGGIVTSVGGNTIHTFLTSGTLSPLSSLSASYLIVAGGGGGGMSRGGGGGAGGLLSGTSLTIDTSSTYLVTVGAGGSAATAVNTVASSGTSSSFSMVSTTAVGGGGGAGTNSSYGTTLNGANGGSGGGASGNGTANVPSGSGGTGTAGQGFAGGKTFSDNATYTSSGGGGGAGAVGADGSVKQCGNGGIGVASSISGTSTYYAGGGGGGGDGSSFGNLAGSGGSGGGGAGSVSGAGTSATANTGGGGGGGGNGGTNSGGSGGSGIVIISYAGSTQQMAGGSVTIVGGNVIHTFTSSGYLTPLTYYSNSLRFRSSASAYLSRTPTVASNRKTWTWSGWVKRGQFVGGMYQGYVSTSSFTAFGWGGASAATLFMQDFINGSYNLVWETTALFRDPAAWYHVVWAYDSTQASSANALKLYVNGVQQSLTFNAYSGAYVQNRDTFINATNSQQIGTYSNNVFQDGYMSNINFIDGQQLTPNSFGTFNSYGVWQPINYGGSYGTNGFYLPFNSGSQTYAGGFTYASSQVLSVADNAALELGSADFCVEGWYYPTSFSNNLALYSKRANTTATGAFIIYAGSGGGTLTFYASSNGSSYFFSGTSFGTVSLNQWNHFAVYRSGNNWYGSVNGIVTSMGSNSSAIYNNTDAWRIGGDSNGNYANGYISNTRIVTGSPVYTSANFTPSTSPLTAITGTQLLTLQNATIIDNSTNAFTITNTGSVTTATSKALSTAVFQDQSPQGNNWTPNNISGATGSTLDYMTDVPTLTSTTAANWCTLNPLNKGSTITTYDGNLRITASGTYTSDIISGTIGVSSGKWYWEASPINSGFAGWVAGIIDVTLSGTNYSNLITNRSYAYGGDTAQKYNGQTGTSYGATYGAGDVIGVAFDADAGSITFYKNNVSQGVAFTGISGTFTPLILLNGVNSGQVVINFGQQPFKYTPPSGFVALNTYNL